MLVWITYTDFKMQIISDYVHICLVCFAAICMITGQWIDVKTVCLGVLIGGTSMFLVSLCGPTGGGDIKLMAALGTWFGTQIIETFLLSFVVGLFIAVPFLIMNKSFKQKVPFGPAIMVSAIILWSSSRSLFSFFA